MDVALISNYLPTTKANPKADTIGSDKADVAIAKDTEKQFNYSEVMMDIEELQNFLFMLIGYETPGKTAEDDIGKKLNLLA